MAFCFAPQVWILCAVFPGHLSKNVYTTHSQNKIWYVLALLFFLPDDCKILRLRLFFQSSLFLKHISFPKSFSFSCPVWWWSVCWDDPYGAELVHTVQCPMDLRNSTDILTKHLVCAVKSSSVELEWYLSSFVQNQCGSFSLVFNSHLGSWLTTSLSCESLKNGFGSKFTNLLEWV